MMKAGCSGRRWACLPVYIVPPRSLCGSSLCGQNKNFAHLRRTVDLARVARDPWRCHGLLRNPIELLRTDPDVLQAARQPEAADEMIQHIAGVFARFSHRGG